MKRCRCANCRTRTTTAFYAIIVASYTYDELMAMQDAWAKS
jgi:hypothetical protein